MIEMLFFFVPGCFLAALFYGALKALLALADWLELASRVANDSRRRSRRRQAFRQALLSAGLTAVRSSDVREDA
jgi:hypothetical protein